MSEKYFVFFFAVSSACTFTALAVKAGCASEIKINGIYFVFPSACTTFAATLPHIYNYYTMMNDICCIGHITHDRVITPAQTVEMAGGTSFYFAWAMSQLPQRADYLLVTKVGDESMDEIERLRRAGVNLVCHHCPRSVFFENIYGDNPNDRTQHVLAKAEPFTIGELEPLEARVFHLGPLLAAKGRVSIDVQGFLRKVDGQQVLPVDWKDKRTVLALTDVLKVNEHEMEVITGLTDAHAAARAMAGYGVREVLVTLGSYGSVIYADGTYYDIPAYAPRQVVDATGCGDTYAAGYLYGRAIGMTYADAGRMAAAMCTLKLEHSGPFDRSMADIERLLRR